MRRPIKTGLHQGSAPIEWAVEADGTLFTAQIPIYPDGRIESGSALDQARLTFANLRQTVAAAGGTMDDVAQVIVYLTTKDAFGAMNEAFAASFRPPYPNRATLIVAGLMVEGAVIEITATARIAR
jgi:enamine deaminase RidA (YjgF/YER057c/UK114 family)